MFGLQRGLFDELIALGMPKAWADTLEGAVGNLFQELLHQGPVKIKTDSPDNALELANYTGRGPAGEQGGNALWVSKGDGVTGDPLLSVVIEAAPVPPDSYHTYWNGLFDNYQTFNYPATFNDDVRINDVIKYGLPCRGSTIVRVEFLGAFSGKPGDVQQARLIDKDRNPLRGKRALDASGAQVAGEGTFPVVDTLGMAGMFGICAHKTATGYAIYMSDLAESPDCQTRKDLGGFELFAYRPDLSDYTACTFEPVVDVCCVNGAIVVCKQLVSFSTPVRLAAKDCGGGSCG